MKHVIVGGAVLGGAIVAWQHVMGFTGWYRDPAKATVFLVPVVIAIQVATLAWSLSKTSTSRGFWAQARSGVAISLLAGAIVFVGAIVLTTISIPEYGETILASTESRLRESGQDEAAIERALEAARAVQTPFFQALLGFAGTLVTGAITSAALATFLRRPLDA